VIEDMKAAGIEDICIVVGWKQHAILDYLGSGEELGVQLTYAVQDERNGLAEAIAAGKHVVGDEDFAVILGDNYIDNSDDMKDTVRKHREQGLDATIGAFKPEDVTSYGILEVDGDEVTGMVEKPSSEEAPSGLAIAGMYAFSPRIFEAIEDVEEGTGGEYQLTDAIDLMRRRGGKVGYREVEGERIDVGTPERLRRANRNFDLRDGSE
jgi:dTDP-glucose pyrophosphorylase